MQPVNRRQLLQLTFGAAAAGLLSACAAGSTAKPNAAPTSPPAAPAQPAAAAQPTPRQPRPAHHGRGTSSGPTHRGAGGSGCASGRRPEGQHRVLAVLLPVQAGPGELAHPGFPEAEPEHRDRPQQHDPVRAVPAKARRRGARGSGTRRRQPVLRLARQIHPVRLPPGVAHGRIPGRHVGERLLPGRAGRQTAGQVLGRADRGAHAGPLLQQGPHVGERRRPQQAPHHLGRVRRHRAQNHQARIRRQARHGRFRLGSRRSGPPVVARGPQPPERPPADVSGSEEAQLDRSRRASKPSPGGPTW